MRKLASMLMAAVFGIGTFLSAAAATPDSTEPEYRYAMQDVRNLQDFLLARPAEEDLAEKPYDLNADGVWDVFDLCLLKKEIIHSQEDTGMKIHIEVNGHTLTATLAENSSAQALAELLRDEPLTLHLSDYGNFEKVGSLPQSLPRNDERITTEPGDLILYLGNQITIYYDVNTWNFTRLGKIDAITQAELKEILGDGDVTVTLSLPE